MPITLLANQFIPTQRADLKKEINQILDDFMEPLMEQTIIQEIQLLCDAANLPTSFKQGVKFRRTGKNIGNIINTWGTEEKPLSKYFNNGTSMHWIEPLTADGVLAWPAQSGRHSTAIFFQGESKEGDMLFSKGHYVSGIPETRVMERGFNLGKKRLVIEADRLIRSELDE